MGECFLSNIIHFYSGSKEWIIALISGLLGSIIGAFGGGWATYYFTKKHTLELEKKQRLNLAKALSIEISLLLKRYMVVAGKSIEEINNEDKPPLVGIAETLQNYFIVFDSSAKLLGLFEQDTANKVIEAYINGKAFFDELIHYGNFTKRYIEAESHPEQHDEIENAYSQMRNYFPYLKKRHVEMKKLFEETEALLEKIS